MLNSYHTLSYDTLKNILGPILSPESSHQTEQPKVVVRICSDDCDEFVSESSTNKFYCTQAHTDPVNHKYQMQVPVSAERLVAVLQIM